MTRTENRLERLRLALRYLDQQGVGRRLEVWEDRAALLTRLNAQSQDHDACKRLGLGEGHLVYAARESEARQIEVIDGPLIHRLALDLSRSMAAVAQQLSSFVQQGLRSESV